MNDRVYAFRYAKCVGEFRDIRADEFSSLLIFFSGRRSETFNTYLPANSRRRCGADVTRGAGNGMVFMN